MPWFERREREVVPLNPKLSPMDYLLARMRDPTTEEAVRTRIAIAPLPFTSPKLAVTALVTNQDIKARLEKAILRSNAVKLIPAQPGVEPAQSFKRRF